MRHPDPLCLKLYASTINLCSDSCPRQREGERTREPPFAEDTGSRVRSPSLATRPPRPPARGYARPPWPLALPGHRLAGTLALPGAIFSPPASRPPPALPRNSTMSPMAMPHPMSQTFSSFEPPRRKLSSITPTDIPRVAVSLSPRQLTGEAQYLPLTLIRVHLRSPSPLPPRTSGNAVTTRTVSRETRMT